MPRYGIKVNRFDGGLNTKSSPLTGDANESPDLQNVQFDDWGAVGSRQGISTIETIATGPVNLLHNYRSDTINQLVAVCDGSLYYKDGTNSFVAGAQGQDIMTSQVRIMAQNMNNNMFLADDAVRLKWDGTTVTRWGVSAPTNMITAEVSAGTGTPATAVSASYKVTVLDGLATESYPSTAYTSVYFCAASASTLTLKLDSIPTSHGVSEIDVYRKRHGIDTDYRLLTAVSGDATSVEDSLEDLANITIATDAETSPPQLSVILPHIGYMFGASETVNPTYLYYSEVNAPTKWDPEQFIRIGDGDGYPIRALAQIGTNLVICKDDGYGNGSIWVLYTPDAVPANWSLSRFQASYGSVAPKAAVKFSQFVMLLNKNGVYNLAETGVGDTQSESLSYNIEPDVLEWANEFVKNAVAVTYQNRTYLSVPGETSSRVNDTIYLYDYIRGRDEVNKYSGAWSKWNTNVGLADMAAFNGNLYGGTYDGKIVALNSGHADDSTAIDSYFQTMAIYGLDEHKDNVKVWRKAYLTVDMPGDWDMTCMYSPDFYNTAGNTATLDLNPGGVSWGDGTWGSSSWGPTYVRRTFTVSMVPTVSKSIMFKFSTNYTGQYWKVYDMLVEYNLRGVR